MKKVIIIIAVLLCSCGPKPDPNTPPPPTEGDICEQACAAWEYFAKQDERCKIEAQGSKDGTSCVDLCIEVEATEWTTIYPECIPKATSCTQAKEFSSKGCQ